MKQNSILPIIKVTLTNVSYIIEAILPH